jgi:uridine phosphorylase
MKNHDYPILEFDHTREAFIEPSRQIKKRDVPEHCVICFFREVLEEVVKKHQAWVVVENHWEDGPHPLYEIEFQGQRLAFFHPGIGAPLSAGLLEEVIAFGCQKFIVCGGSGVLRKDLAVGHLVLVDSAVRDEGVSYHYLPASREIQADRHAVSILESVLQNRRLPYIRGKTWTIDAPYRETTPKIAARRAEGCITVEMEAAGLMAVAQFRQVPLGVVLYGGDDLSGDVWDHRGWQSRRDVRESLFWLSAEACFLL